MPVENTSGTNQHWTIVVIEDQNVMRSAIKRVLEKDGGYEVIDFTNGVDAIAYIKGNSVDLILSDIYMPKGTGFDVLTYVRSRAMASDVPIIFISGEATRDDIVQAITQGANDYIIKPFEPPEFLAKVKSVLERYMNPPEWELKVRQAESHCLKEEWKLAHEIFADLNSSRPKTPRIMSGLAQCYLHENQRDEGLELLKDAIEVSGLYFPAYAIIADLFLLEGKTREAKEFLLKELSINGKRPQRRKLLSDIYFNEGDTAKAMDEMRKAIVDSPRDEEIMLAMADLYFRLGETDKSIHYYTKTRKHHHQSIRALEGIAQVYEASGQPEKAISTFNDQLRQKPTGRDVLLVRAKVLERQQKYEESLADLEAYLVGEGDTIECMKDRVRLLSKLGRYDEALPIWKEILRYEPTGENFAKVGLATLKLGQYQLSAKFYERALALNPNHAITFFNLGFCYENLKIYDKAYSCYQSALKINPASAEARNAARRIEALTGK